MVGIATAQTPSNSLFKLSVAKTFENSNSQEWSASSIHLRGVTPLDIVTFVYRVNPAYFWGRERLLTDRFDIDFESASLPRQTSEGIVMDTVLRMLGVRIVERSMDVDVVILDKPRKLGPDIRASFEANNSISIDQEGATIGQTTMAGLCRHLELYFDKPVFDKTKMIGRFRWELGLRKGMSNDEVTAEIKSHLGLEVRNAREKIIMYVVEPVESTN